MRSHALVAVLAFGLGVAVALLAKGQGGDARAGRAEPPGAAPAPPHARTAEEARLKETLLEREREIADLRHRVETLEAGGAPAEREAAVPAPPKAGGPRFLYDSVEKGLRAGNWSEAGAATARLMPLLSEAVEITHGRRPMRAEFWGDITTNLGPIVTLALKLEEEGVDWSHPSVLANLVHATLREAGHPLDEAQEDALDRIGLRFIAEDGRRRAAYGDATPALRRLLESHAMQDRFFAEADALLSDGQRGVLWPPGVKGVVGLDVFSGSTVWDEKLVRLTHGDRADLRARMHAEVMRELEPGAGAEAVLQQLVGEWEASLPDAFLAEPDAAQKADVDMEPTERVRLAATKQLALFEALLARAPLDDEARRRILEEERVLIPQRR